MTASLSNFRTISFPVSPALSMAMRLNGAEVVCVLHDLPATTIPYIALRRLRIAGFDSGGPDIRWIKGDYMDEGFRLWRFVLFERGESTREWPDVQTAENFMAPVAIAHDQNPDGSRLFRHLNFQKCSEPVSFLHF